MLNAYECADIQGWRKNLARTAAFYFTELPDAYATRTGRPENVGVIGVAVFREKQPPVTWRRPYKDKVASDEARADAPAGGTASRPPPARFGQDAQASADAMSPREEAAGRLQGAPAQSQSMPVPAPMSKLGTGHGRSEDSPAQMVRFERESATPNETIAIYYDRRENLVAMGILPPPVIARSAEPVPRRGRASFRIRRRAERHAPRRARRRRASVAGSPRLAYSRAMPAPALADRRPRPTQATKT